MDAIWNLIPILPWRGKKHTIWNGQHAHYLGAFMEPYSCAIRVSNGIDSIVSNWTKEQNINRVSVAFFPPIYKMEYKKMWNVIAFRQLIQKVSFQKCCICWPCHVLSTVLRSTLFTHLPCCMCVIILNIFRLFIISSLYSMTINYMYLFNLLFHLPILFSFFRFIFQIKIKTILYGEVSVLYNDLVIVCCDNEVENKSAFGIALNKIYRFVSLWIICPMHVV